MRRVDEAVRAVLSDAITTDLKDPRIGFVTVTAVDTTPDLRQAKVFVSVLGSEDDVAASLAGLQSKSPSWTRYARRSMSRPRCDRGT